ncbi:MAG: PAS domain S-box protein [Candidatus Micrarchaeota archaeon]
MSRKKLTSSQGAAGDNGVRTTSIRLPAVESPMRDARFLQSIIDHHPSPVFVVNVKTREVELANAAAGEFQEGSSCNALLYGSCIGSPPSNRCLLPIILSTKDTATGVHRICNGDKISTNQVLCVPVLDDTGEVSHVIHYFTDISKITETGSILQTHSEGTERTLNELREEKERAQMYLDIASVVLVSLDSSGRISLLNRKGGELLGCEPQRALGLDWFDTFIPEQQRSGVRAAFNCIIAGEIEPFETHENAVVSLDGREKLILWRNAILKDDENIIGTLSSGEDVTERRAAECALKESELRFRELANQLPQTVFESDSEGKLVFANTYAYESFGYLPADLKKGLSLFGMLVPEDVPHAKELVASFLLQGKTPPEREYTAKRKDGTTFPILIYSAPITSSGKVVGIRGIVIDISERKRLEEASVMREKMESVSRLAGGIAHDFNNMLSPILAGTTLSQHIVSSLQGIRPEEKYELLKLLQDAENASVRASRLTSKMMNLSRGNPLVRQTAPLDELVRETAGVILSGSNIELFFTAPNHPLPSSVDRTQIDQVISNIVTNAKYAMPSGGRIRIDLRPYSVFQHGPLPLRPGEYVRISIADEGAGIPPEVLPKIFEPYFTTKGSEGTGLGLATSFSIVKKHDGHLAVETELGKGTTFIIYLPISNQVPEQAPRKSNSIMPGHGRILVMDDEEFIRSLALRVIRSIGYSCDCARNGEEAVHMYHDALESGQPYSVVVLDLTVKAGMGGIDALSVLMEIDPNVRAIASSGYAEGIGPLPLTDHGFAAVLPKPYTVSALSKTLHKLINED